MPTGYGEFIKGARQGSMNPQQWQAYLIRQNRTRSAYRQAFSDLQAAAQREGLNIAPPELGNNISQAEAQAKLQEYANNVNQNLSYFDVDVQLNTAYRNASASGLSVPRPVQYGKTVKDAATAKVILDNYTKKVSQIALQKGLTNAINDIRAQAAQQGVTLQGLSPDAYAGLTESRAQYFIDNYLKNANNQIAVKNYNDVVNSISAQARAQGISVAVPSATGINSANVQNKIDQYAASVNSALLQKSVSNAVDSIYMQAKTQGVEITRPSVSGVTSSNAQATVDNYLTKVNKALESKATVTKAVAAPSASPTKSVTKVTATQVNTSVAPSYIVYDDIGREQTITQSQLQQLQKAQQGKKWNENYQVIPQEVANSRANWWINSQGLYEWVPVTDADKKKLSDRNAYYSRFGQTPKTTLTLGASPSEAYSKEWYRTGGNHNKAPIGSGDIKLQQMKANTAGITGTIKKVNTAEYNAKLHPGQIQLKDGSWVNQVEKVGSSGTGSVKIFTANLTPAEKIKLNAEYKNRLITGKTGKSQSTYVNKNQVEARKAAAEALKEAQKIRNAYIPVEIAQNKYVDAVQMKGGISGTGEDAATVQKREIIRNKKGEITEIKILAASGTAKEYAQALKNAKEIAATPITDGTSAGDRKAVLSARKHLLDRMTGKEALTASAGFVAIDEKLTFSNKSKSSFKTVDQLRQEKIIARGGLGATSVKMNRKFQETLSYGNVTKVWSETTDKWNGKVAKFIDIPELREIEKTRNAAFTKVGLEDERKRGQDAIYGNKYGKASMDFLTGKYDTVRTKPVTSALTVAALYASGVAAGAVIEGGLGAAAAGAGKVAVKATSPIIKKVASVASKSVQPAGRLALVGGVVYDGGKVIASGDAAKTVDFVGSLAVGGFGYSKGTRIAKDPISIIPNVRTVKLQEVTPGHGTGVKDIRAGETFSIGGKDIISRNFEGKFVRGSTSLPKEKTKGKIIQSFDSKNSAAFHETVKKQSGATDAEIFRTGNIIAKTAYGQRKPVTDPKSFDILSESVPVSMKPVVKSTILGYNKLRTQNIEVYGSVSQKLQMEGFFSRTPKDIEVSVSSIPKFIEMFRAKAVKAGFTEGKEFRITAKEPDAPKIEFKKNGKWEKGVEVFSENSRVAAEELAGYRPESGIAFGYKGLKPLKVESARLMKLQEQAARKHAGATTLQDGVLKPVHPGRVKDIKDLIEIGVANEITFKTGIAKEIIAYAKMTAVKDKAVLESPIVSYIVKHEKLPTASEMRVLTSEKFRPKKTEIVIRRIKDLERVMSDLEKLGIVPKKSVKQLRTGKTRPQNIKQKFRQNEVKVKSEPLERELLFESKKISASKPLKAFADTSKSLGGSVKIGSSKVKIGSKAVTGTTSKVLNSPSKNIRNADKAGSKSSPSKSSKVDTKFKTTVSSKLVKTKSPLPKTIPAKSSKIGVTPSKVQTAEKSQSKVTPSKSKPLKPAPIKTTPSKAQPSKLTSRTVRPVKVKKLGVGSSTSKSSNSTPVPKKPVIPPKKKPSESKKAIRSVKNLTRFTRKIQNQFGNLDTMFGKSTAKPVRKTIKKSIKRVQRA